MIVDIEAARGRWHEGIDGRAGVYCGDVFSVLPRLIEVAGMGGPIADVVITDPPYGEFTVAGARTNANAGQSEAKLITGRYDAWTPAQTVEYLRLCGQAARRWVIAFTDYRFWPYLDGTVSTVPGLRFVRAAVWLKPNGTPQISGDRPAHTFEAIAIMHRAGVPLRWNGGGSRAGWDMRAEAVEPEGIDTAWIANVERDPKHPTRKPSALLRDLVEKFSDPGEVILDGVAGSGSTLVAALSLGRRGIGIEVDEHFARHTVARCRAVPRTFFAPAAPAAKQGVLL